MTLNASTLRFDGDLDSMSLWLIPVPPVPQTTLHRRVPSVETAVHQAGDLGPGPAGDGATGKVRFARCSAGGDSHGEELAATPERRGRSATRRLGQLPHLVALLQPGDHVDTCPDDRHERGHQRGQSGGDDQDGEATYVA